MSARLNELTIDALKAPTASNGTTYGYGTSGQVLKTDGDSVYWGNDNNTTYSAATQSANGLMSAADKKKLDGIAAGANAYTHPSYTSKASGFYKVTVDATGHVSAATAVTKADITALGIPGSDTNTNTAHTTFTWTGGTTAGPTGSLSGNHTAVSFAAIPSASDSASGIVTTGAQTFVGTKTFGKRTTTTSPSSGVGANLITLTPPYHTGGPWHLNIYDDSQSSWFRLLYGSTERLSLKHDGTLTCAKVYGAVWNDYAEYRTASTTEPGRCVVEVGDDTLVLSSARLQPGAEIVSDTFGFAIGETETSKTPVATSGRVLAYPYEDRELFKRAIGRPVCSGPNGTVSIMTQGEYEKYGYCAIGTVSAVPDYETWGTGNVPVDGRVWIRIR